MIYLNKLKGAIYGLAIGDAIGVPYEFKHRGTFTCTDMIGFGTHNQPIGTWSDDTSLTLATLDSINKYNEEINYADIRKNFKNWLHDGIYTPFEEVFDVGGTTAKAINIGYGINSEDANGNGSLMRILPLAFIENVTDEEIGNVSAITHAHAISKDACVQYVKIPIQ